MLVTGLKNVTYLTGFTGDSSYLWLMPGKAVLLSDSRFDIQIAEECPGLEMSIRGTGTTQVDMVVEAVTGSKVTKVAIESTHVNLSQRDQWQDKLPSTTFVPTTGLVEDLRMVKDKEEIKLIRESVSWAEKAFAIFRASLRPGQTEKELHDNMEHYARYVGGISAAFPTIIGVGPRGALPHAVPTRTPWTEDDFVLVDWGVRGTYYVSDLTRVLVGRKITSKFEKVYAVVQGAQKAAREAIKPGATTGTVDEAARKFIADAGYGNYFGHGLGHGIGLDVHEAPYFRPGGDVVLKPGMVVTVEPGIYLKGWGGIRLEDDILVTRDGHERLSSLSLDLADMVI